MPESSTNQRVILPDKTTNRKQWARRMFLALAVIFTISFLIDARTSALIPRVCIWQNFTGLPCPFCGLTRSICEISHGRLFEAMDFNLFGPVVYATGILALAMSLYIWVSGGKSFMNKRLSFALKWAAAAAGLLWLVWWVWRMVAG
ncbi:DUF2752 domain-containing protein [Gemmatimonadota bacterium]